MKFAVDIAGGRLQIARLQRVTFDLVNFSILAQGLWEAFKYRKVKRFLVNFFAGNVTNATNTIAKFFGNPNVNERRILGITKMRGGYSLQMPDILRSVVYDRFLHYSPQNSQILNVFDISSGNLSEHFLVPMILAYLNYDAPHRSRDGSVAAAAIRAEMQDWSFSIAATTWALARALNGDNPLVERASAHAGAKHEAEERFRITTTGAYYLADLIGDVNYLEAMWCDTPGFRSCYKERIGQRSR